MKAERLLLWIRLASSAGVLVSDTPRPVETHLLSGTTTVGPERSKSRDALRAHFPFCPSECDGTMHHDEWCNTACFREECGWDAPDCEGWCAPDCKSDWIGDGTCDRDCFREECEWDKGDCDKTLTRNLLLFPLPSAEDFDFSKCEFEEYLLYNDSCDWALNIPACNFDNGACDRKCAADCWTNWLGDGDCDTGCFYEECGWDKGDCEECAPGCRPDRIGNGICDKSCMNAKCYWDMGDCAGVCKAYPVDYDTRPFWFNACRKEWIGDGECDCNCFNSECTWDGGDCLEEADKCRAHLKEIRITQGLSYP